MAEANYHYNNTLRTLITKSIQLNNDVGRPLFDQFAANYLIFFQLNDNETSGKHVPTAAAWYKDVVCGLPTVIILATLLYYFLVCMTHCCNDEFKKVVFMQDGFL